MTPQEILFDLDIDDESLDSHLKSLDASEDEKLIFKLGVKWARDQYQNRFKAKMPKNNPLRKLKDEDV